MPDGFDKYDFLLALIAMIVSIHIVGMINQRECAVTANEISKRCDLPVDVQNIRIRDDELLDAKDLADMENKWVTFKARFTMKNNKLSMEMVRLYSNKKMTSDWRMDPQTDAKGFQWFTVRGRWVAKPLSFEFDDRFFMVDKAARSVTRSEPWFNFKAYTWLGVKVLKQIDLEAVPERKVVSHSRIEAPPVYIEFPKYEDYLKEKAESTATDIPEDQLKDQHERTLTSQSDVEAPPVYIEFPKYEDYLKEKAESKATGIPEDHVKDQHERTLTSQSDVEAPPVYIEFPKYEDYLKEKAESKATAIPEDHVKDQHERTMTSQSDVEAPPVYIEFPKYEDYLKEKAESKATAISEDHVKDQQDRTMSSQSDVEAPPVYIEFPKYEDYLKEKAESKATGIPENHVKDEQQVNKFDQKEEEKKNSDLRKPALNDVKPRLTTRIERHVNGRSQPKCSRFSEYIDSNIIKNTSICLSDELLMDECSLDTKARVTSRVDRIVKMPSQPTCPRFPEYNATKVVKNTSICLPDELTMDECPLNLKARVTLRVDRSVKMPSQPTCPRFPEYNATEVVKNTSICLPDELTMDECPLNLEARVTSRVDRSVKVPLRPTCPRFPVYNATKVVKNTSICLPDELSVDESPLNVKASRVEHRVKVVSQPKCPRFPEYNASKVVKNTSICLPDELSADECPLNANEASTDTASDGIHLDLRHTHEKQSIERDMGVVDNDCDWYSPAQVLLGATAVTTVTVTVATTYVMMARPQYFWAP